MGILLPAARIREQTVQGNRTKSTSNHSLAAAAVLGDLAYFTSLPKETVIDSSENLYFGNPLRAAAKHGHHSIVRLLLDRGVDVNKTGANLEYGKTALQAAAFAGHGGIVKLILEPSYQCRIARDDYEDAILKAASTGHLNIAQLLVQHVDMQATKSQWNHLLAIAAFNGQTEVVHFALQNGANANCIVLKAPFRNPLSAAAKRGHAEVMKVLLAHGARPALGRRYCPLKLAAKKGYRQAVQVLLDNGVNITNGEVLRYPAGAGEADMLLFLLERGAKIDHIKNDPRSLLQNLARRGYVTIIRILAGHGVDVDVNVPGSDSSPMLEAMKYGQDHVVKAFLELGASELSPIDECIMRAAPNYRIYR